MISRRQCCFNTECDLINLITAMSCYSFGGLHTQKKTPNPKAQINGIYTSTKSVTHSSPSFNHPLIHENNMLEMAQTSCGTQPATVPPPERNHLLLISAHSPPPAYSSQLDFRSSLSSSHFHKSCLIDRPVAPDLGVLLRFGFQAVAGFVP